MKEAPASSSEMSSVTSARAALAQMLANETAAQPAVPQNWEASHGDAQVPQWAISLVRSMQWPSQQSTDAPPPQSDGRVQRGAQVPEPQTRPPLHSRSFWHRSHSLFALHTPLAQMGHVDP